MHSSDTLRNFDLLDVAAPALDSEMQQIINDLKAKKAFYQSQERGAVPTIADKEAKKVKAKASSSDSAAESSTVRPGASDEKPKKEKGIKKSDPSAARSAPSSISSPTEDTTAASITATKQAPKTANGRKVTVFSLANDFPPLGGGGAVVAATSKEAIHTGTETTSGGPLIFDQNGESNIVV
jgi:hypothetical protein